MQINLGNHLLLGFSNIRRVLLSITKMSDVTCLFFEGDKKTFLSVENIFWINEYVFLSPFNKQKQRFGIRIFWRVRCREQLHREVAK